LRVKICGLTQAEDARMAERAGADFLGFVLTPGFGRSVPPGAAPALVEGTSRPRVAVSSIDASVLQLHGSEPRETVEALRGLGDWRIWKAVRAGSVEDVARAVLVYGPLVDALLLEGRRQGIVGGGGVRLEVEPERARELIPDGLEFVLAGGLDPDSVGEAVARFRPNIVDVSSGVEREPGRKDEAALIRFVRAAKEAM
jgi:phosphoribosylanthranilate isomerase